MQITRAALSSMFDELLLAIRSGDLARAEAEIHCCRMFLVMTEADVAAFVTRNINCDLIDLPCEGRPC
jgi:hypothetical protein